MKEHRKHPPSLSYPGETNQVQVDRHGNIRVSLRDKEKRKNLVLRKPDWDRDGAKMDDRKNKRFKVREKEIRVKRERDDERLRLADAARERGRRIEMKKMEKDRMRHRLIERDRTVKVKRVHEVSRNLTPIRSPIRSPKSSSSRSLGEIRARTPSESPPRSKLRSIVRSLPKSPLLNEKPIEPDDSFKPISSAPCGSIGSPEAISTLDNSESKSEQPILPAEDMSPISNSSSLGDIDGPESSLTPEKILFDDDNKESSKQSDVIVSDENFSDWSEDEDELLNKPLDKSSPIRMDPIPPVESINPLSSDLLVNAVDSKEVERAASDEKSSIKPSTVDVSTESQDACSSLQDDALESISDDECDAIIGSEVQDAVINEESSVTPLDQESLDDLDIDWANLIQEPKSQAPDSSLNSARRRMSPANILTRIGFSHQFAGAKITEKLINYCKEELKENFTPFRHSLASLHCFIGEQVSMREKLFESSNFFSSALSARKDLDIRRILAHTFVDFSHLQSISKSESPSSSLSAPLITTTSDVNESPIEPVQSPNSLVLA